MKNGFFANNKDFQSFSPEHYGVLGVTLFLCIALPLLGIYALSSDQSVWLSRIMALYLTTVIVFWTVIRIRLNCFNPVTDLPLDICNIIALLLPLAMWQPSLAVNEVLYFWVMVGTLQAIITPNLEDGFPGYTYFKYFTVHAGLVVYIIYTTTVFDLYPDWRSIWISVLYLNVYAVFILGVNLILGSNYFYIMRKPPKASILNYLGPWPWYILSCEALVFAMCALVYLPIWLLRM